MGYTHYWRQFRPFSEAEWAVILSESKRICAKAQRGLYAGAEDFASSTRLEQDKNGFRVRFNEPGAWRTFAHPEIKTAMRGDSIRLAGPSGQDTPELSDSMVALNGCDPDESYESFILERAPEAAEHEKRNTEALKRDGIFGFCKTEYRPYDAVVVSILAVARQVAPEAIKVSSDGGPEAIKLVF